VFEAKINNGVPEITCEQLNQFSHLIGKDFVVVDVRRPDEFNAELGHVQGASLSTLGPALTGTIKAMTPEQTCVFVCRSGGRSGQATIEAHNLGYKKCFNMTGGMLRWNELKLKTETT
jgi:sulfur dioxygenase